MASDPRWAQIQAGLTDPNLITALQNLQAQYDNFVANQQSGNPQQIYVSAPAAGAVALIAAIVGAGGGYYYAKSSKPKLVAKKGKAKESLQLNEEEE